MSSLDCHNDETGSPATGKDRYLSLCGTTESGIGSSATTANIRRAAETGIFQSHHFQLLEKTSSPICGAPVMQARHLPEFDIEI